MKRKAKRRISPLIIIIVIAAVVLGAFITLRNGKTSEEEAEPETATVEMGTVRSIVSATGTLEPLTSVEVKSNVGGEIVELFVDDGDAVSAGQLIARIDPRDQEAALERAQADLASARAGVRKAQKEYDTQPKLSEAEVSRAESSLRSARASLEQIKSASVPQKLASARASYDEAKAALTQAQSDLSRQKALLERGFVAESQVEVAQEKYDSAKARLASAEATFKTIKVQTDREIAAAEAKVKEAEAAWKTAQLNAYQVDTRKEAVVQAKATETRSAASVEDAQTQLGYTNIYAPRAGVVVNKYVEEGSIITAGRSSFSGSGAGVGIIEIADITSMLATVDVDETDIGSIYLGHSVNVTVDAYPDETFTGKVTKIAPSAVVESNVVYIPVEVTIDQTDLRLKPGLNATCDFITKSGEPKLTLPKQAVSETPRGKIVMVLTEDGPRPQTVKTGQTGDERIEILSGVSEGDRVLLDPSQHKPSDGEQEDKVRRGPPRMF